MTSVTATRARADLFNLIRRSLKTHQPTRIVSKAGDVVLVSQDDFENLLETLELLSTPGVLEGVRRAKRDIAKGRTYSMEEVFRA